MTSNESYIEAVDHDSGHPVKVLSYKRISEYTKSLDRSQDFSEIAANHNADRYGFFIHEANEASQSLEHTIPIKLVRKREKKWLSMLKKWEKTLPNKDKKKKIKLRCRKGIPPAVRGLVWQYLSGAISLKEQNPSLYEELTEKESPDWEHIISKDVPRTFPYHELFIEDDGPGQQKLHRVLKAFSLHNPEIGYSQAMSPIVAVLLMHMTEQDAFWVLVAICEKYLTGYFGKKLESLQLDSMIFSSLLAQTYPYISRHMHKHNIDPVMYIVQWMMCMFSRTLPFSTALRVWDIFFCEGIKMLFRAALGVVKIAFPTEKYLKTFDDDYQTIQRINNIAREDLQETIFIPLALSLKITTKQLKELRNEALNERPDLGSTE